MTRGSASDEELQQGVDRLEQQLPGLKAVSANPVVRALRLIKQPAELALMQTANDITIRAMRHAADAARLAGDGPVSRRSRGVGEEAVVTQARAARRGSYGEEDGEHRQPRATERDPGRAPVSRLHHRPPLGQSPARSALNSGN